MEYFAIHIHYFAQNIVLEFDEKFPSWDIFLCRVAQHYPLTLDEDIVGNMIFLWTGEDEGENFVIEEEDLQFALESFDEMNKIPSFRIWFDKLPFNIETSSFVDLTT